MKQFTATEAKNILGQIFDTAQVEPVRITKNGKDFVVVLSAAQFERLHKSEPRRNLVAAFHEDSMNRYADVYAELAK